MRLLENRLEQGYHALNEQHASVKAVRRALAPIIDPCFGLPPAGTAPAIVALTCRLH